MHWGSLGSHSQRHNLDLPGPYNVCRSAFLLCNRMKINLNGGRTYLAHCFRDFHLWFIVLAALEPMIRQSVMAEHMGLATSHITVMGEAKRERKRWMTLVTYFSFTKPYLLLKLLPFPPNSTPTGRKPLAQQLEGTFKIQAIAACLCGEPFTPWDLSLPCSTLSGTCY